MKRKNFGLNPENPYRYRYGRKKTPLLANTLKIGEVSKKSGIPVVTLRFFESSKLIQSVKNAETKRSNHRRYDPVVLAELEFIHLCRNTGFSIPETRSIMKLYRGFKLPAKAQMNSIRRTVELIKERRQGLKDIERALLSRLRNPDVEIGELPRL